MPHCGPKSALNIMQVYVHLDTIEDLSLGLSSDI